MSNLSVLNLKMYSSVQSSDYFFWKQGLSFSM